MPKTAGVVLTMQPPRQPMGWQIEYEVCYDKKAEEHPAVEISVSMEDSIHWFCRNMTFRVLSVHPDPKRSPNAPLPLFYRPFPDEKPKFANHVNSGPARPGTEGNWYKPVFEFDDKEHTKLDPHIKTNP
jgi:hypothetical protein